MKTAFAYTDRYFSYDYGPTHPLRIERLRLTWDLCRAYDLFDSPGTACIETEPASPSDILRFHSADYVETLQKASSGLLSTAYAYGLGPGDNPIFPGLWEWSLLHTGASLQCARLLSEGKVDIAFNIAGGLHHAAPGHASGFCYINDPVLAILFFLEKGYRVMYLDIDAHHGDGVQFAFYEDPRVLTVSFHQDGQTLFPGTGRVHEFGKGRGEGFSVNVPMAPGTDDHVFWRGFHAIVPRLIDHFNPDVMVSQLGVDTFLTDPLASLELTTNGFMRVISFLKQARRPWLALGGGGYNITSVARAWTLAWAGMNDADLPDNLPQPMIEEMRRAGHPGNALRDPEHNGKRQDQCARHMDECVAYIEKRIF